MPFLKRAAPEKMGRITDEEAVEIAREIQTASFLKRADEAGNFAFMHRSFMEFFLARKLFECLAGSNDEARAREILNTLRYNRKVIYFLALLDVEDEIREPLQQILKGDYLPGVSENALQILYWSGRVREQAEETIEDPAALRAKMSARIPAGTKLAGAKLQESVLEAVDLNDADFSGADLTEANLNHSRLSESNFSKANLAGARIETALLESSDFREADLTGASFNETDLTGCDFTGAIYEPSAFVSARLRDVRGIGAPALLRLDRLLAIVQRGHAFGVNAVAYSPDGKLIASGGQDGLILIHQASDGHIVATLEGHSASVWSVAFSPDGQNLASGSYDSSVMLWDVNTGKRLEILVGNLGPIYTVAFAPNGKYLVAAGVAGRLQFWDFVKGETFLYRYEFGPGAWLDLLPDGRFDASPEGMRYLRYTEEGTFNSYAAEDLVKEFYQPDAVREVLSHYVLD